MDRLKILFILSIAVLFGCSKDESISRVSEFKAPIITGIIVVGESDMTMSKQDTPNINNYSYCDETMTYWKISGEP